jgi:hypothetical protein
MPSEARCRYLGQWIADSKAAKTGILLQLLDKLIPVLPKELNFPFESSYGTIPSARFSSAAIRLPGSRSSVKILASILRPREQETGV